ncbi:MAG TPA: bifunctional nuclease family protein [Acidimicrobiales bacterium]|nr:bifunctional nuclease family protein [Acidimicrobiales bacterium]
MKHVDLFGLTVEPGSGAPLVLLREHDEPHRVLPIFVGGPEAAAIALALGDERPPRPLTHDLMAEMVTMLDVEVERVEVTALRDGTFFAELAVRGPTGSRRVDSRPSDAIALAVRLDAPLYASPEVLDEAGAILTYSPDEATIEQEVEQFRSTLEGLDPADFADGRPSPPPTMGGGGVEGDEGSGPGDAAGGEPGSGPDDPSD